MTNRALTLSFAQTNNHFTDVNNRKKRHDSTTKEGVVVNTFIKDEYNWNPDVPMKKTPLPADMFDNNNKKSEKWYKSPIIPMVVAPLALLGAGALMAKKYKTSYFEKYKLDESRRIPPQPRIIAINDDSKMSLLMLVQDPSWKNFQVAMAVIATAAAGFTMKNVVDGFKEVIVKKNVADIKRDKEENLISIETRAFSGKNQIVRSLLDKSTRDLNNYERFVKNPDKDDKLTFGKFKKGLGFGNSEEKEKSGDKNNILLYSLAGAAAIAGSVLLTKSIFKNLRTVRTRLKEKALEVEKYIGEDIPKLKNKKELENMLVNAKLSDEAKDVVRRKWEESNATVQPAPVPVAGHPGAPSLSSLVQADPSAFIYTWLLDKNNPQTKALAGIMCGFAGLAYIGQSAVKGVKEVQVEKANANTEVDLQDRLVQVELKNFYAKKRSFIAPVMEDTKEKIRLSDSKEEIKRHKQDALAEIKNGPPFVYS